MRWTTRERPKIDRIACPCLIRKFIDPEAGFFFVPYREVAARAAEPDAIPIACLTGFSDQSPFTRIFKNLPA